MTVMVTGAGGFIGSRVVARLRRWDRTGLGPLRVRAVTRTDLDLANEAAVDAYLARVKPERIVHLAAALLRREDASAQRAQWRDTFTAGRVLVERAAAHGVAHLLMAGSVEEFGDRGGVLAADCPSQPLSTYGLCKSLVREVAAWAARRSSMRVDWFRPFVVYGPGQTGEMLVAYAFRAARDGVEATFTDGLQQRDFIYVDDIAHWLVLALQLDPAASSDQFQVHHLGTGTATPVREVLDAVAAEFPRARFRIGARPRRAGEPELQVAARYTPAEPILREWVPCTPLRDGLARTAAWWREATSERA
jgi:nucleoside-diphosphate-sugar epimerase